MKTMTPQSHRRSYPGRQRLAALLLLTATCSVPAQSFLIIRSSIAGGGASSAGGSFVLNGTIAQPDASGPLISGNYSVRGGFWVFPIAVQVAGSPTLTIVSVGHGHVNLSWSPATPGFILQQTDSLTSPNWTDEPSGGLQPVTIPATSPAKFYRLIKR